jgi:putative DNA primase/helicase
MELHGESRFTDWDKKDESFDRPTINRAGFRRKVDEGIQYYVFREVFQTEICEGLSHQFVANALKEQGMLIRDSEGKNTVTSRLPELGTQRVYLLTDKVYGGGNED